MVQDLVPLAGSTASNRHPRIGAVDPQARIELTVKLRRKTEDGLPSLDDFIAGKRARISRATLIDRYGASADDAAAVQRWALSEGLSVSRVDLGQRQVQLVGSAAALSRAFGVTLSRYRHLRKGVIFHSPDADIQTPKALAGIITGVFGLDDRPVAVHNGLRVAQRAFAAADPQTQFPGTFYPNAVAKLYNFPDSTGAGQRVAILEFGGGFDPAALNSYFTGVLGFATAPTVNAIMVLGSRMDINDGATGEVYLDIEVVGGMAPGAVIDVYFAPWSGEGYLNAINQAIHGDDYAAVSISYGIDEDLRSTPGNPGWPALFQSIDEAFQEAAAIGLPVFVSSGDQGSGATRGAVGQNEITILTPDVHASYPATSPYATAVGGTMLYAADGAITREVVWNELGEVQTGAFTNGLGRAQDGEYYLGGATGGGVSDRYPTAPSYQTLAGVTLQSANTPPKAGRCIPDVAGNAGASTGYLVTQPPGSPAAILPVGGTSAAAPMWAALMACVREALSSTFDGQIPVFFFNDFAYACGKTDAFRDIVEGVAFSYQGGQGGGAGAVLAFGNNRSSKADGYTAAVGYDLCTGWGSPNGAALIGQLATWLRTQPADPTPGSPSVSSPAST